MRHRKDPPARPADARRASGVAGGSQDINRDLGFGSVVTRESRRRLLNRDGTFNVVREGLSPLTSLSLYHYLLTVSWPRFLGLLVVFYLGVNSLFATAYFACGAGALHDSAGPIPGGRWAEGFFFSVQTFATIGYGQINPATLGANLLVAAESLVGLLGFALATGLLFARFSRPVAKVLFSEVAVIAPYRDVTAFQFRIANGRSNQLIELDAQVLLSLFEEGDGRMQRTFFPLTLERRRVAFFPLSWTIVHPIDEQSPLHGHDAESLMRAEAEFLVLLTGFDETFSQSVHTRSSYKADEVVWGARFADIFNPPTADGVLSIDIGRLHQIERTVDESAAVPR